MILPSN